MLQPSEIGYVEDANRTFQQSNTPLTTFESWFRTTSNTSMLLPGTSTTFWRSISLSATTLLSIEDDPIASTLPERFIDPIFSSNLLLTLPILHFVFILLNCIIVGFIFTA